MRFFLVECLVIGASAGYGASVLLQGRLIASLLFFGAAALGMVFAALIYRGEKGWVA